MADFYSDLVNWTTATVVGASVMLVGVDFSTEPAAQEPATPQEFLVASTDLDPAMIRPAAVTRVEAALEQSGTAVSTRPEDTIREAELQAVEFTRVGLDKSGIAVREAVDTRPRGQVVAAAVNIRSGPGTGNPVVSKGLRGDEFVVTGEAEGVWLEIILPNGSEAWVHGRYFRTLEQIASAG